MKLRGLGIKKSPDQKRVVFNKVVKEKGEVREGNPRGGPCSDLSFTEALKRGGRSSESALWVDVSDCVPRGSLGC